MSYISAVTCPTGFNMEAGEPNENVDITVTPVVPGLDPNDLLTPSGANIPEGTSVEITPIDVLNSPVIVVEVDQTVFGATKVTITFEDEDGDIITLKDENGDPIGTTFEVGTL